jgi:hypothetical protein
MVLQLAMGEVFLQACSTLSPIDQRSDWMDLPMSSVHVGALTCKSLAAKSTKHATKWRRRERYGILMFLWCFPHVLILQSFANPQMCSNTSEVSRIEKDGVFSRSSDQSFPVSLVELHNFQPSLCVLKWIAQTTGVG